MKISDVGLKLIQSFEGCYSRPYLCPAVIWTVGYGHVLYPEQLRLTKDDRHAYKLHSDDHRTFTQEEIDDFLRHDLVRFERSVTRLCPGILTQGQFDALVSFAFNVGSGTLQRSTLRTAFNRGDYELAADIFLKYNKAGGQVLRGLTRRRLAERSLFLS